MRPPTRSSSPTAREAYLAFIRAQVPSARGAIVPPATLAGWDRRLKEVADGLRRSFGRRPEDECELAPEVLGTLDRDGYAIDRLTFQSRPGVRVTANLYRPEPVEGRRPAVLSVHGHWAWARIDPHVQARCIGLARRGYVCLAVDAFGAGERAVEPAPGTYHGGLLGASLWPAGVPLLGLQVYDNRRAVDYLVSRPDVDPARLAITGASGGGNQTLYAGATDDRLAAVVPVCGIGTFESYLGAACCVCEALVGGLSYATTGDVLALVAPRALLVINATRDAVQFSVAEAKKSVAHARERFRLLGAEEKIRHLAVESGHDYNRPMREALYGWLDRWLRGRGDGSPVAEPELTLEDPQDLRCYPDGKSRPQTIVTIPEFALREGRARLAQLPPAPDHPQRWEADALRMRAALRDSILIRSPRPDGTRASVFGEVKGKGLKWVERSNDLGHFAGPASGSLLLPTEGGIELRGRWLSPADRDRWKGKVLLLRPEGMAGDDDPLVQTLLAEGWRVLTVDLRAIGASKPGTGAVAGVTGHNEAEWGLWVGRPLLGQWTLDASLWFLQMFHIGVPISGGQPVPFPKHVSRCAVLGVGPFSVVALMTAAATSLGASYRPWAVGLLGGLTSFVGEGPWKGLPMGLLAPNLLDVGDVAHLAALAAPSRLSVAGGVEPNGAAASPDRLEQAFAFTRSVYQTLRAAEHLTLTPEPDLKALLRGWDEP